MHLHEKELTWINKRQGFYEGKFRNSTPGTAPNENKISYRRSAAR